MIEGVATRSPAKGQLVVIRPYRKNLLGDGEEKVRFDVFCEGGSPATACLRLPQATTAYHLEMSRIRPEYFDAAPSDRSVAADVLLRQEPDEDEEDEENDGKKEDDEADDEDDGYSE